jgi:DNA-binding transcriptional regulator PaaX
VLASPLVGSGVFLLGVGALSYLFRKSDFNREAKRLQKKGYVALTKTEKGWLVKILKKGRQRYEEIEMANLRLSKSQKWDGKWRLFIFDIPEELRYQRDYLRRKLKELGLYNIQRSVFAYPYDCRNELDFVGDYYNIGKYATYAEVNNIDIDKELKKHFKLNKILA